MFIKKKSDLISYLQVAEPLRDHVMSNKTITSYLWLIDLERREMYMCNFC